MRYAIATLLFSAALIGQTHVPYGDFESGIPGQAPPGWQISGTMPGLQAVLTNQGCVEGKQCAMLTIPPNQPVNLFGTLAMTLPANTYPASKIRLRAAVRVLADTQAQMWMGANRRSGGYSFLDNMADRPITSSQWAYYTIDAPIVSDTVSISFGLLLHSGTAWLDDVTIEVLTPARSDPPEAPRALSDQGLANLVAFAKLAGYVRYFHPSDQSYQVDWENFVINGVRAVENAATPDDLARLLQTLFDPIAPAAQVFKEGAAPDLPPDLHPTSLGGLSVTQWSHYGLGIGVDNALTPPTYSSQRKSAPVTGRLPDGFTDPAQPYVASLGSGLTARVPVALYMNGQGTLPSRPSAWPTENWIRNVADRGTRLADVILAWNTFQHFYPYFDVEQVDMPGELRRALAGAALNTGPDDFLVTMQKLVAALKDGHGWVGYDGMVRYNVPLVWAWVEGQLIVTRVKRFQGQQIRPGDRILTIDGKDVGEVIAQQAPLEAAATPQWNRLRTLQDITICDGRTQQMQLDFEPYLAPGARRTAQFSCLQGDTDWGEYQNSEDAQLGPGLMYIDLGRISAANLARVMPQLQSATGIVFDFRGYPQSPPSYLQNLTTTTLQSEIFLVPTPTLPDQTQMTFAQGGWSLDPQTPYLAAKRIFLIDARAISQAETDMDIVERYKLADFVGEPTAGTTGDVNPFTLPGGFHIHWTGMKVLKPDGSRFHGVGIRPTIPVPRTRRGIAEGQDEILQRGWQLIMGPQAGPTPAITAAGIVNSASFVGGTVARGELVAIFGTNLGSSQPVQGTYDESGFLTKYLGETRVFFDGIQAPLTYVSSTQVNAIVPYGVNANTNVTVEYQLRGSNQVTLPVAVAAPGVFAYPGKSQAVIANSDGSLNSDTNAAQRGDFVALFATGEGQTVPQGVDGVLPAPGKWPAPRADLEVRFGGIPGEVLFKGDVYAGVLQVNVRVPPGAPAGNAVPLTLSVGGVPNAGALTIALK